MCDANHMLPLIRLDFSEGGPTDLPLCFPFDAPPTLLSLTSSAHNLLRPITDTLHTSTAKHIKALGYPASPSRRRRRQNISNNFHDSALRSLFLPTYYQSTSSSCSSQHFAHYFPSSRPIQTYSQGPLFLNLKISLYSQLSSLLLLTGASACSIRTY